MEDIHGGEPWNNRKTIGSGKSVATSSSSGNTLSTYQHTSGSGSFSLPSFIFDQVVVEQPPGSWRDDDETRQRRQHIKGLLEEFCANSSAALNRWFSDLGIAWVLRFAAEGDAPARLPLLQDPRNFAGRWIQALADISESVLDTYCSCFSHSHLQSLPEEVEATIPDPVHFSRFIQETMLKMLSFVDAIVAPNPNTSCVEEILDTNGAPAPLEKLKTLLDVRGAVFMASFLIQPLLLHLSSSAQAEICRTLLEDMEALRSDKDDILAEAIWNTMQEVTAAILADDGNHDSWDTPQGPSASIHKVTRSIERYIRLLEINYRSVDQIVRKAADCGTYVPETTYKTNPFTSMMTEMVSCLEEKLAKMSQSFPNKSLGLLFLINNLHSLWQQLHPMYDTKFNVPVLARKIEDYIDKYLQEAWAPVLARLRSSPSTLQFGRIYFPLSKFESEFRKIHNDQKLWKVPDPELRKKLRKAITDKVASGFTNFLEENTVSTRGSTITPREVEDMLQELFEG